MSTQSVVQEISVKVDEKEEVKEEKDEAKKTWCTKQVIINSALLALWIAVILGIGFGFGLRFPVDAWYASLVKSPGSPPNAVFPVVWSLLYISLAVIGWFLMLGIKERQILYMFIVFIVQQILNYVWVPVFQTLHQLIAGLVILNVMIVLNAVLIIRLWMLDLKIIGVKTRYIAAGIIPYFLWLCYAMHLNAYAVAMNPSLL